jgi:hypothetical protein
MRSLRFGSLASKAARHLNRLVGQFRKLFVKEEID